MQCAPWDAGPVVEVSVEVMKPVCDRTPTLARREIPAGSVALVPMRYEPPDVGRVHLACG
ncbi:hypothetical protein GCM10009817_19230 [Terrabacter lapilli]|uniref:Uncharacterized protein n=1 Tax=Terrabacter lapilli TaxID=436231 RepID=A0ABN2S2Y5_9MICO